MAEETPNDVPETPVTEEQTTEEPVGIPIDIGAMFEENRNLKETLAVILLEYGTDGRLELPSEFELPAQFVLGGAPDEKTGKFVLRIVTDPAELERFANEG